MQEYMLGLVLCLEQYLAQVYIFLPAPLEEDETPI